MISRLSLRLLIDLVCLPPGKTKGNIFRKKNNNIRFGQPATLFLTDHKRLVKLNGSGAIYVRFDILTDLKINSCSVC